MEIDKLITLNEFITLPASGVANLVRANPKVCVFPINNTRRWFMLEHGATKFDDPIKAYMEITGKEHIRLYKLLFDHGLDTLINPVFGVELFRRGAEYMKKIGADGLEWLTSHPDFTQFYDEYQVKVRFYGDHREILRGTNYAYLSDKFDETTQHTQHHTKHNLYFGVCGTDATDAVANFSVQYFKETGTIPGRKEIISAYYGEYVAPADLFISSDKFWVFDYPLLSSGEEDLYYMVAPSLYLSEEQLRRILYDHLYARQVDYPNFDEMSRIGVEKMRRFYTENKDVTLGVGKLEDDIWYPQF